MWEPILPSDLTKPGSRALSLISDTRVRQFWDAGHFVSSELKSSLANSTKKPECCEDEGILWDLAAVYGPSVQWRDALPAPLYIDGTVINIAPQLEAAMTK